MKLTCNSCSFFDKNWVSSLADCNLKFSLFSEDDYSFRLNFSQNNFIKLLEISIPETTIPDSLKKRLIFENKRELIKQIFNISQNEEIFEEYLNELKSKDHVNEISYVSDIFPDDSYISEFEKDGYHYDAIKSILKDLNFNDLSKFILKIRDDMKEVLESNGRWDNYVPKQFDFKDNKIIISDILTISGNTLKNLKNDVKSYVESKVDIFIKDLKERELKHQEYINLYDQLNTIIKTKNDSMLFDVIININKTIKAYKY